MPREPAQLPRPMSRRSTQSRRLAREWGVRGTLALLAAGLGYAATGASAGWAVRTGDAGRAHRLAPGDGRITGLYAQALSGVDATTADRARADVLARTALRQDPTAVAAVATLGLDAQIRGDIPASRRLFAYAERLSRRDLRTQIWAIEDSVERGDVAGALRHYDIALRTSRDAPGLLFPILASAIVDLPVRAALAGTLARRPAWAPHLLGYLANEGPEFGASAALFAALRRMRAPVADTAAGALVDRMIGAGQLGPAWAAYAAIRPGADRRRSRDPRFTADTGAVSRFDWRPVDTAGLSVSIGGGESGEPVEFGAAPGTAGPVLEQMQWLPAGRYRLSGHAAGIDQPPGALPYWSLRCGDGRELGGVAVGARAPANGVFAGSVTVPADCPTQVLTLVLRPSDAMAGVSGQIDCVQLEPAR